MAHCMGGILTIVAFHILDLYKVVSEGRHKGLLHNWAVYQSAQVIGGYTS